MSEAARREKGWNIPCLTQYTVYFSSDKKYIVAVEARTSAVTLGWVFLVPTEPTIGLVESDPAAPAAPNNWGGGAGSSSSSEQTTANQTATDA